MANLPAFYADNVRLIKSRTVTMRGNVSTNIVGGNAKAFDIKNCENLRAKNNRAHKIRSMLGTTIGFNLDHIKTAVLVYNTISRAQIGFNFLTVPSLDVYNMTSHLCNRSVVSDSSGIFKNIAISAYPGYDLYKKATGFYVTGGAVINLDYCMYSGLAALVETGTVTAGTNVSEDKPLYMDELNDDLTPDHISPQVNSGIENPLHVITPSISGIESKVTDETTAQRSYWYDLIDNSFWDIENDLSAEASFIKAYQSRIAANSEVETSQIKRDTYLKTAESVQRFAEMFPAYVRYETPTEYNKRIMDLWYATQNPAVVQSYQNGIGGYNLLPSFFKHMQDYADGWIVDVSYIAHDNWLNSMADLRYGIGLDVLGVSTLNQATSAECYTNVMSSIADIAPVRWFLHEEVQPSGYIVFTDLWNGFEDCTLTNMIYDDDFSVSIDDISNDSGIIVTPFISTENIMTSSVAVSGQDVEVSLLDRVWSESIERDFYWRQGTNSSNMTNWEEITDPVGGIINLNSPYVQFKINVDGVIRQIDYEFQGIALRGYVSVRSWEKTYAAFVTEEYIYFYPGAASKDATNPPIERDSGLAFPDDDIAHICGWQVFAPPSFLVKDSNVLRFIYGQGSTGVSGDAVINFTLFVFDKAGTMTNMSSFIETVTIPATPFPTSFIDIDITSIVDMDTDYLVVLMNRDSSVAGDNLAGRLLFWGGRSL